MKQALARVLESGSGLLRRLGEVVEAVLFTRPTRARAPARLIPTFRPAVAPRVAVMPDGLRVYAIGDIHGRADLLDRLISMMDQDVRENPPETRPIAVFLGDYVDRGFQSKEVIDLLLSNRLSGYETYFLKGNHEAAMLQFMGNPAIGPRWAEFGGVETLVSYGVRPPRARTNMEEWERACTELRALMPNEHYHFLTNLSLSVRIGDYVFVHAGMRPGRAIDQQTEHDMLWIRDEFLGDNSPMEAVIVHGHTPMERPFRDHRRVGVDTGAYLSGRLTAARFDQDAVDFLTTNT